MDGKLQIEKLRNKKKNPRQDVATHKFSFIFSYHCVCPTAAFVALVDDGVYGFVIVGRPSIYSFAIVVLLFS